MGLAVVVVVLAVVGVSPAWGAVPGVAWSLQTLAQPSSFSAADSSNVLCPSKPFPYQFCDRYTVVLTNVGTLASSGVITVTDTLPEGITTSRPPEGHNSEFGWVCETKAGVREVVTCAAEASIAGLLAGAAIEIPVTVSPGVPAGSVLENDVEVTGGAGAPAAGVTAMRIASPAQPAPGEPFAVQDFSFSTLDQAGGVDTQAAGHPGAFTSSFHFPSVESYNAFRGNLQSNPTAQESYPVENVKQIITDLPPGVIGDALAAPTCSLSNVTNLTTSETQCPSSTRIGKLVLFEANNTFSELSIFNVTPERGHAAEFAVFFPPLQRAVLLYATLAGNAGNAHARVVGAPQPNILNVAGISLTIFGNPAVLDQSPLTPVAFATNPSDCAASGFTTSIYVDTWQNPARVEPDGEPDLTDPAWKHASATSPPVTGCEALLFNPSLSLAPEPAHSGADEPAGYESVLQVPQNEYPNGLATPPLKTTIVTLPAGVAVSPSAANGLVGCQPGPQGIGLENETESNQPGHCPAASTVGSVEVTTPLLKEVLKGSVFVAEPSCGGEGQPECTEEAAETGGVFALYIEVGSENSGIHLKLKGKIEIGGNAHHNNLAPGQIRTSFIQTPQQPFSELKLNFKNGPGAPLANPQTCGSFATESSLTPWSSSTEVPTRSSLPFTITGCENRFSPAFSAGTSSPQAGSYSPFTLTLSRQDREQDLSGITVTMPEGLDGKITGIPECGEAQANTGTCSPASRIGTATASAGSGPRPYWQSGPVYLTGPYNGAPFGLSVVVPAKAGPYNLGNITVRAAININPRTAQVTVVSNPLPQSIDGVPLRIQTVNVTVGENNNFTYNPTSCEPTQVTGTATGTGGTNVNLAARYQAAGCASLKFTPKLTVTAAGKASKANGASLNFKIAYPPGAIGNQSWFNEAKLVIPKQLPSRLTTIQKACLASTFQTNPAACPEASIIGHAIVHTPVLPDPLTGPVYFVSYGAAKFPDVVLVLQGDNVTITLDGETLIKHGITSATFRNTPDVPFETLEVNVPTGPYSEFTTNLTTKNKYNLCGQKLKLATRLKASNGQQTNPQTPITITGCPKPHHTKHTTKKH